MIRRTRINPVSKKRRIKSAQMKRSYQIVSERARGRCEFCGSTVNLQCAHIFGRIRLGSWSNEPAFLMMLCADDPASGRLGCHQAIDQYRDPELRRVLEWRSVKLFAEQNGLEDEVTIKSGKYSAERCALWLIDQLTPAN